MSPSRRPSLRRLTLLALGLASTISAAPSSAQVVLQNVDGRQTRSLDGDWHTIVDPYENGYYDYRYQPNPNGYFRDAKPADPSVLQEYDFDASATLEVPGDWNTQRPELFLYEGTVWYRRLFEARPEEGRRVFVHFGAANYEARVWLNGEELGYHAGGFTPFAFEVTDVLRAGSNSLVVKVDNARRRAAVPTVNTDWWNYGGLTRGVRLVEVADTFVRDYVLRLGDGGEVTGWVQLDGSEPSTVVVVRVPEADLETVVRADETGLGRFVLDAAAGVGGSGPALELWSPENPRLYDVEIAVQGARPEDVVRDRIGFRTIETRGHEILLNGESVFLRGISIHEEAPGGGRVTTREEARTLLTWAKELGCNFVRLAHYPHGEWMVREADRMGLMVWGEIPVYWTILWENPETYELAERQLREMIERDRNRASVVIWSVANETPRGEARLAFLESLIEEARRLDSSRLISAATELTWKDDGVHLDDPLGDHLDVLGVNEYVGWYGDAPPEAAPGIRWHTRYDKPLIVSELGAGALAGHHGEPTARWTEEYQERVYEQQIEMLRGIEFLRGTSPWILMDFRSPRRPLPGIQDFWNRKGLVSEQGERKKAFFVLRDFYRELAER